MRGTQDGFASQLHKAEKVPRKRESFVIPNASLRVKVKSNSFCDAHQVSVLTFSISSK